MSKRKLTPKQRAQKAALTRAAAPDYDGRAATRAARAAYWRALGADVADDGTLLPTEATQRAKRRFRLAMLGGETVA